MKNNIIFIFSLLMLFCLFTVSSLRAQAGCLCDSHNSDSFFCIKNGKIYERESCREYRFAGMNVHPLTRLDNGEQFTIFTEARQIGIKVIRFFAGDASKSNGDAINAILDVLNHPEAQDFKFIVTLTNFYPDQSFADKPNPNNYDPFYPQADAGSYNGPNGELNHEWFDWSTTPSYRTYYKPWVEQVTSHIGIKNNPKILAFELGNELKHNTATSTTGVNELKEFTYTMIGIIKANSPQNLVTTGNLSTWHSLAGNTNTNNVNSYLNAVYKSGSRSHLADFVTIHNYDNYWTATESSQTWHRTDQDVIYAMNNNIPWVVEEFGFTGPQGNAYAGGCWDTPPGDVPDLNAQTDVWIPNCNTQRPCAINLGLQVFKNAGASGIMGWGFNPFNDYDRGIGDSERGFDAYFDPQQYEVTKSAWSRLSFHMDPVHFWYECDQDMSLNNSPNQIHTEITCKAENTLNVNHNIVDQYCINYHGGASIDFFPDSNGYGFEAVVGANATAKIISSECIDCSYVECPPFSNEQELGTINPTQEQESAEARMQKNTPSFKVYPIPFQNTTTLSYELEEESICQIQLFDVTGKLVQTVLASKVQAKGKYEIRFGELLPDGVYLCKIQMGSKLKTIRLLKNTL